MTWPLNQNPVLDQRCWKESHAMTVEVTFFPNISEQAKRDMALTIYNSVLGHVFS